MLKQLIFVSGLFLFFIILSSSECQNKSEEQSYSTNETAMDTAKDQEAEIQTPGLEKLFNSTWRLTNYNDVQIDHEQYGERAFILQFNEYDKYEFSLDVNSCVGSVQADDIGKISFELPGCTEMCCDSELAIQIANALHKTEKYRLPQLRSLMLISDEYRLRFEAAEE